MIRSSPSPRENPKLHSFGSLFSLSSTADDESHRCTNRIRVCDLREVNWRRIALAEQRKENLFLRVPA
jgi:hypothetical protein